MTLKFSPQAIAPKGMATSFPDANIPPEYCFQYKNLFTNLGGYAEKRQGIVQVGDKISSNITVTGLHELILTDGSDILFATGGGQIWRYDDPSWTKVFEFEDKTTRINGSYIQKKLVFSNGVNRNVWTENGSDFFELRSVLDAGRVEVTSAITADPSYQLVDTTKGNWTIRYPTQYDLVYYTTTSAYGCITSVTSAMVEHTPISPTSTGLGVAASPVSGSPYTIIDMIEANIVPVSGDPTLQDNKGVLTSGSSSTVIYVAAVTSFADSELRVGDFIYNETKNAVTEITQITTASLNVISVSGQGSGDVVYFLKSSMPIANDLQTHYGRLYAIDARDPTKVRISGPDNPQNFGGYGALTYDVSVLQPDGEILKKITTFQRFLVFAGSRHIYIYEGTDPTTATTWSIVGSFPVGILAKYGITNVGSDLHVLTNNGVRSITLKKTSAQFADTSTSVQIDNTLRDLANAMPEHEIFMIHYPKRNWMLVKIGSELYVYNLISTSNDNSLSELLDDRFSNFGAWHLFDGPFAQQKVYFVNNQGELLCGGANGIVSMFDQKTYSDLGQPIQTVYESGWLPVTKTGDYITKKHGKAIKPVFEAGSDINIVIEAYAPYEQTSTDRAIVRATTESKTIGSGKVGSSIVGGTRVTDTKVPLRWNGEVIKVKFTTDSTSGPFILSQFALYYVQFGVE